MAGAAAALVAGAALVEGARKRVGRSVGELVRERVGDPIGVGERVGERVSAGGALGGMASSAGWPRRGAALE